jgi:pantoate--beta-alanine ligase
VKTASRISVARSALASGPNPIVLVPTMGALHAGHEALIQRARRIAGRRGSVAVSIFVNPTQFDRTDDFENYPRPARMDAEICRRAGVDLLFQPADAGEIYAPDASVSVDESALSVTLCGASRPGHFRGVCTVVTKLLNILQPDDAVFGEKDWQQLAIIRRLVRDLNLPVRIHGHPTVREPDGLALSSRNRHLSRAARGAAPQLFAALTTAASARKTPAGIEAAATRGIGAIPGARIDYVSLVDAETLAPPRDLARPARLAAAIFFGTTRLIDNVSIPSRA